MMKSRGELFLSVLQADSRLTSCNVPYADLPQWAKDVYEEAAAEYDKATSQLPEDVDAFLNECAAAIPDTTDHAERLIAFIRKQSSKIDLQRQQLRESLNLTDSAQDVAEKVIAERNVLRERIAELEATIKQMEEDEHDRRMEAREEYD